MTFILFSVDITAGLVIGIYSETQKAIAFYAIWSFL